MPPVDFTSVQMSLYGLQLQAAQSLMQQTQLQSNPPVAQGRELLNAVQAIPGILRNDDQTRIEELLRQGRGAEASRSLALFAPALVAMKADRLQSILYGPGSLRDPSGLPPDVTSLFQGSQEAREAHLLRRHVYPLAHNYFLDLAPDLAIELFERLTVDISRVRTENELFTVLTHSLVPGVWSLVRQVSDVLSSEGGIPIDMLTRKFGLRAKVTELLENRIRAQNAALVPIGPQDFLGAADPRTQPVPIPIIGFFTVRDRWGGAIGEARAVMGSREDSFSLRRPDGTILSAMTTRAGRSYQEDGIYTSWFTLPDGTEVKVIAGADGAGGMGGGDVASSAWLQGIHAGVAEAARAGQVPLAGYLYEQGVTALRFQKGRPDLPQAKKATGAGSVIVIVGDQATIATAGDAMVVFAPPPQKGVYGSVGYTEIDSLNSQQAIITKGIDGAGGHHLYQVSGLAKGSRFVFGSDGLLENLIGKGYKDWGSPIGRLHAGIPAARSVFFAEFDKLLAETAGRDDAGRFLHDLALSNIQQPGRSHRLSRLRRNWFFRQNVQLPAEADTDNIFAWSVEVGSVSPYRLQVPPTYQPLERIIP